MQWPSKRFDRFYQAFIKRRVIDALERRKEAMISALWANSNYDDDKGTRAKAIEEIEANFDEAVVNISSGNKPKRESDIDKSNPFFKAMEKGQEKIKAIPVMDSNATMEEVIEQESDFSRYIDQD